MTNTLCLSFAELAQSLGPRIDAALAARTRSGRGLPARLREAMRYSLLAPGKRLRPMLVLMAAEACGGTIAGGHAGGLRRGDGPRLFAHSRRPAGHGRRRFASRAAHLPQGLRRGDGHSRRRRPVDAGLPGAGREDSARRPWRPPVVPPWPRPPAPATGRRAGGRHGGGRGQGAAGQVRKRVAACSIRHMVIPRPSNIWNRSTAARPGP